MLDFHDEPNLTLQDLLASWNANAYSLSHNIDDATGFFDDTLPADLTGEVVTTYEHSEDDWYPIACDLSAADPTLLPTCFIDGKMSIHLVGGGKDMEGIPRPVLAGQMGVGCIYLDGSHEALVSRVVMLNVSGLPSSGPGALEHELSRAPNGGFKLVSYRAETATEMNNRDFNSVHVQMYRRGRSAMLQWEKDLTASLSGTPVCVDGRVRDHLNYTDSQLVIGVVKSSKAYYLTSRGLAVRDRLGPGERTPAVLLYPDGRGFKSPIVTFYMRLSNDASNPTSGIVRVEIREDIFNQYLDRDFHYFDALVAHLYHLRCQRPDYGRAAITTEPIYEIEQIIGSSFLPSSIVGLEAQSFLFA